MRFKLGLVIGAGIGYLVTSGKGKELLAQAREQMSSATPVPGHEPGMAPRSAPDTSSMTSSSSVPTGAGPAPDAFGAAVLAEDAVLIVEDGASLTGEPLAGGPSGRP